MFSIQGKKFGAAKLIKSKKKHEIQISLIFGNEKVSRRSNRLRFNPYSPVVHTDGNFIINKHHKDYLTPENNSAIILTPKCFSKTPTPSKLKIIKFSVQRYEFDPPKTMSSFRNTYFEEPKGTPHSRSGSYRKAMKTTELAQKFQQTEKRTITKRLTMKDLNINLPIIVNNRKQRKRASCKPGLIEL
ncbi:hypothetical protein SteCoe_6716 [Stentor coeruleus]|uniref:Uncharacterized protein n=1 Tax=Stentor coeruleus TaxID=5963 RepID=A0A1R2CPC0_9CILI|nr:hypothetical protein SteCoe_6716 [Stentor coeruleus]